VKGELLDDTFILDAVRTPIGKHGGALCGLRPDDLAAGVLRALLLRSRDLDPAEVDDVLLGDANGGGEDNRDVARMAVLLAGMPTSVPGVTLNRLCGSGMEAVIAANRAVAVGDASLTIAGGVESMSRAPWVLPKPEGPYPPGPETLHSTTLGWRMVNAKMSGQWTVGLGECTGMLVDKYGISREVQDEFAVASHRRQRRPGRAACSRDDLALVELNEAFAAQSLACLAEWPALDPDLVNTRGGAIAIGHPLGCSGARSLATSLTSYTFEVLAMA
jgi:acetyl-CoA acetyltransferase